MSKASNDEWVGQWAVGAPVKNRRFRKQKNRQKTAFVSIVAWPLIILLLQATLLNPLFIEGLLRDLGFGETPSSEPEPVLILPSEPVDVNPEPIEIPNPLPTKTPIDMPTATPTLPTLPTLPPVPIPTFSPTDPPLPEEIAIDLQDGKDVRVEVDKIKLIPGQTKAVILKTQNIGNVPLSTIFLKAVPENALFADPVNGLNVKVWSCEAPWGGSLKQPVCPGGALTGGQNLRLAQLNSYQDTGILSGAPQSVKYLFVTYTLPGTADNRYKKQETNVTMQLIARRSG